MTTTERAPCDYASCTDNATFIGKGWAFCSEHSTSDNSERLDPGASAQSRRQAETTALRLMREGYSLNQTAERTGLSTSELAKLALDFPSGRPTPVPRVHRGVQSPQTITELPTRTLAEHPANVRTDLGDVDSLALTIAEHGVLQPLLVTRGEQGRYVVLDGHRRLAAAIKAGLPRVPVTLRGHTSLEDATVVMLVTGLQKLSLDVIDEARAYRRLEERGYTQKAIAELIGKNQGHVSQRLALLNLSPVEQQAVRRKEISVDAAYKAGRDRSSKRMSGTQSRPKPKRVLHFNASHPQAPAAADLCRKASHEVLLKLGPACGPCWEQTIRRDAIAIDDQTDDQEHQP